MNSSDKLKDIQYLINEHYSDKEPLEENQRKSKECFNAYCNDIEKKLKILELLKKKKVDLSYLDFVLKSNDPDETKLKKYNRYYACEKTFYLTKQEFDLIKDWLERE